ncbi:hypothetical protein fugu_005148 [Takifugu bimaculatus]|uniref:Cadherin domain-containing protein n=1 Tax=Takifugu bimaculatus TaxID=433685 RepID=A0A4Z2B8X3_9TELE|nr:hypothetical protein fugu_005148 [Takifugu bimaculatus]
MCTVGTVQTSLKGNPSGTWKSSLCLTTTTATAHSAIRQAQLYFQWGVCYLELHSAAELPTAMTFISPKGNLFVSETLCWRKDALMEFDLLCDILTRNALNAKVSFISIHWRVGQGPFREGHLRKLLKKAARSDSAIISRRRRSINSSPQFQPPMYQVSVAENKPAGTPVVVLKAVDVDEGEAGRLEYFIEALFDSRSNNLFAVDPANGAVSTVEVLDRETKDTHVFRVTAVDHGVPRRTAMATLTVTVGDTNDHDPAFEQQDYKENIRENLEIGYEVLTVRATDGDAPVNGNILYRIINSNGSNDVFEIDSRSGVIRTKGSGGQGAGGGLHAVSGGQ